MPWMDRSDVGWVEVWESRASVYRALRGRGLFELHIVLVGSCCMRIESSIKIIWNSRIFHLATLEGAFWINYPFAL